MSVVYPFYSETNGVRCNGHSASGTISACFFTKFSSSAFATTPLNQACQAIVDMAMNSLGYRDTVQVMGISLNTVLQHLKNVAKTGGWRISTPQ